MIDNLNNKELEDLSDNKDIYFDGSNSYKKLILILKLRINGKKYKLAILIAKILIIDEYVVLITKNF